MNNEIEEIKEQEKNEDKIIEKNIVNDHRFISPIVISNFIDEEETNIQYYTSTFILRNNSLICKNSSTNLFVFFSFRDNYLFTHLFYLLNYYCYLINK